VPERDAAFKRLRDAGIGANVHYAPVHLHPHYREKRGTGKGLCPVAETAYKKILTLPLWPGMDVGEVEQVAAELLEI
jgi:perosamine synthetase